jgi:hypothetical protein
MSKAETYRAKLAALDDWDESLQKESGLPGPRESGIARCRRGDGE